MILLFIQTKNKQRRVDPISNKFLGKPVPLKDVSVTINEVPLEDGYLTKQTGDFTIMYSYHDPYSLQELHAQSLLHVLPLNKQIDQKNKKTRRKLVRKTTNGSCSFSNRKVKQTRSLELARISRKISESNKTIRQEAHLAPQVSGLENEILEPKIKQQSEKNLLLNSRKIRRNQMTRRKRRKTLVNY